MPRQMVAERAFLAVLYLLFKMLKCLHVTVAPEDRRMAVLSSGIWKGLKA